MTERQAETLPAEPERTTTGELARLYEISPSQAEFLAAYLQCGNISKAAEITGLARNNHYQALGYSEGYQKAYSTVRQLLGSKVIEKMLERAIEGDHTLYKGQIVTDDEGRPIKTYDTVNQIFLAKSLGKLTDQPQNTQNTGNNGPTVNIYLPETQTKPPIVEVENQADTNGAEHT